MYTTNTTNVNSLLPTSPLSGISTRHKHSNNKHTNLSLALSLSLPRLDTDTETLSDRATTLVSPQSYNTPFEKARAEIIEILSPPPPPSTPRSSHQSIETSAVASAASYAYPHPHLYQKLHPYVQNEEHGKIGGEQVKHFDGRNQNPGALLNATYSEKDHNSKINSNLYQPYQEQQQHQPHQQQLQHPQHQYPHYPQQQQQQQHSLENPYQQQQHIHQPQPQQPQYYSQNQQYQHPGQSSTLLSTKIDQQTTQLDATKPEHFTRHNVTSNQPTIPLLTQSSSLTMPTPSMNAPEPRVPPTSTPTPYAHPVSYLPEASSAHQAFPKLPTMTASNPSSKKTKPHNISLSVLSTSTHGGVTKPAKKPSSTTTKTARKSCANTTCRTCGKTYTESSNLSKHIRTVHLKLRPFHCNQCPARFAERNKLGKHIQSVHERARPFQCDKCGATFSQASDRKRHRLVLHEGRRPFVCNLCGRAFGRRSSLTQHCTRVHKIVTTARERESVNACSNLHVSQQLNVVDEKVQANNAQVHAHDAQGQGQGNGQKVGIAYGQLFHAANQDRTRLNLTNNSFVDASFTHPLVAPIVSLPMPSAAHDPGAKAVQMHPCATKIPTNSTASTYLHESKR